MVCKGNKACINKAKGGGEGASEQGDDDSFEESTVKLFIDGRKGLWNYAKSDVTNPHFCYLLLTQDGKKNETSEGKGHESSGSSRGASVARKEKRCMLLWKIC